MALQKLPVGIQTFSEIINEDYLYVDKTALIHRLLCSGKCFFLSRPRRSGKSLTLSTIASIYRGERALFADLWIEDNWDWHKVHPVIHFSSSGIGYQTQGLEGAIEAELRLVGTHFGISFEQIGIDRMFSELLRKLSHKAKLFY